MDTKTVYVAYFSPNGNTKNVAIKLAKLISDNTKEIDFTSPESRTKAYRFDAADLVIFACPTYAGKLPNKIMPFIKTNFTGNGAFAVPIVTFGNRAFDNSLAELCWILSDNAFSILGAGAFVTKHAFSRVLGKGRPDYKDEKLLAQLANHVKTTYLYKDKLANNVTTPDSSGYFGNSSNSCSPSTHSTSDLYCLPIPGEADAPYYTPLGIDGTPAVFLKAKPKTNEDLCDDCGICAQKCPMGSISFDDYSVVLGTCIKCHACVNHCHRGAKYFDDPAFLSHKAMLEKNYLRRADSAIFIQKHSV